MWNNTPGYPPNTNAPYPPPGGDNGAPFFPSPGGFGPPVNPPHSGYAPSYEPPQGPPFGGFPNSDFPGPPSGPNNPFQVPNPSYPPPPGPPPGHYPPPPGPPPGHGQYPSSPGLGQHPATPGQNQYPPPPGPPPGKGQYPSPGPPNPGHYQPPPGPPNPGQYHPTPGPPNQGQYPPPPGPPNQTLSRPPTGPPPQQGPPGPHSYNQNNAGYPGHNSFKQPAGPPSHGAPPIPGNHLPGPQNNSAPHMPNFGPQYGGPQGSQFSYQYSKCNGKKKALCIGVNYKGQQAELKGCINDALNVKRFLCTTYGYKEEDIVMLTDDARDPRQRPTTRNMIDAMQWLVRDARPNDSLFFHFSGHGGQAKDRDGDEEDGYDEVIYPLDFKTAGHIVDDTMHDILVKPLPAGCRLTCIFDCCHSGSALDLPYMYTTDGKIKEPNVAADIGMGLMGMASSYAKKDMGGLLKGGMGILRAATGGAQKAGEKARKTKTSPADVISWSGCKDSQTSADTFEAGKATGAMSYAFISVLTQNKNQTYQSLLNSIRDILKSKYSQKPQLAASHPMDTNAYFIC